MKVGSNFSPSPGLGFLKTPPPTPPPRKELPTLPQPDPQINESDLDTDSSGSRPKSNSPESSEESTLHPVPPARTRSDASGSTTPVLSRIQRTEAVSSKALNARRSQGQEPAVSPLQGSSEGVGKTNTWKLVKKPPPRPDGQGAFLQASRRRKSNAEEANAVTVMNQEEADSSIISGIEVPPSSCYQLADVGHEEARQFAEMHPEFAELYEFRIQAVVDSVMDERFNSQMKVLKRGKNPSQIKKWNNLSERDQKIVQESGVNIKQELEVRKQVDDWIKEQQKTEEDCPFVHTLTAYHGTLTEYVDSILTDGLEPRQTTDGGYFGKPAIYTTPDLLYSIIYAGKKGGVVLKVDLLFRNLFPLASVDKLSCMLGGFDGKAVFVRPASAKDGEKVFVSIASGEKTVYKEIVMQNPANIRIGRIINYRANKVYSLQLNGNWTGKDLQDVIITYMEKYPQNEQFNALSRKLEEASCELEKKLNVNDGKLLILLQRSIGEKEIAAQNKLGTDIQELLTEKESNKILPNALTSSISVKDDPQEAKNPHIIKGDEHFQNQKYKQACAEYEKALKLLPNSFRAYESCGRANSYQINWEKPLSESQEFVDEAIKHYEAALKIRPSDHKTRSSYAQVLICRAKILIASDLLGKAKIVLEEALEYDSLNYEALGLLANIYFSKNCLVAAYVHANRALISKPDYSHALRVRGAYFATLGNKYYLVALKDLNQALLKEPDHANALIHRSRLFISMKKLDEARKDCDAILEKNSKSAAGLKIRARVALMQNDLKQADKDITACYKDNDFACLSLMGELWSKKGKFDKAVEFFDKSIAFYQEKLKKEQESRTKVLSYKDHMIYYETLLQRAEAHDKRNADKFAECDYEEAIKLFPNKPEAYKLRGNLYRLRKMAALAEADFKKAAELEAL